MTKLLDLAADPALVAEVAKEGGHGAALVAMVSGRSYDVPLEDFTSAAYLGLARRAGTVLQHVGAVLCGIASRTGSLRPRAVTLGEPV